MKFMGLQIITNRRLLSFFYHYFTLFFIHPITVLIEDMTCFHSFIHGFSSFFHDDSFLALVYIYVVLRNRREIWLSSKGR